MNWEIKGDILYLCRDQKKKYRIEHLCDYEEWAIYRTVEFRWFKPFLHNDDLFESLFFAGRLELNRVAGKSIFRFLNGEKGLMLFNRNTEKIYIRETLREFIDSMIIMENLI